MAETIIIIEQEMCDCAACPGSARMAPRWACGCEEDICPECGCCSLCCECDGDEDDPGLGDDFDGDAFDRYMLEQQRQFECHGDYLPYTEK